MAETLRRNPYFGFRPEGLILALIVTYLVSAVFYSIALSDQLRFADERLYVHISENIWSLGLFSSNGQTPTAERAPLYPFFISFFIQFTDGILFARLANFLLVSISAFLSFRLLSYYGHANAGLISVILILTYPLSYFTAGTLYPQSLATFLLMFMSYLLLVRTHDIARVILAGLIYGFLLLTLPSFIALMPLFGFVISRCNFRHNWRHQTFLFSLFIVAAILVLAPWTYRNYEAFGRFVYVSANSGFMLIMGNSENSRANIGPRVDIYKYQNFALRHSKGPIEKDTLLRKQAFEWIMQNPGRAVILYIEKFINWFNFSNKLATESEQSSGRDIILFVSYYPLLILASWYILIDRNTELRTLKIYIVLLYLGAGAIYAIFFTRIRYRVPLDIMMIVLVSMQIEAIVARYFSRPGKLITRQ